MRSPSSPPLPRLLPFALGLVGLLALIACPQDAPGEAPEDEPPRASPAPVESPAFPQAKPKPPLAPLGELIVVADPAHAALLTPVLARRTAEHDPPAPGWLLVSPEGWDPALRAEAARVRPARVLRVGVPPAPGLAPRDEALRLPEDLSAASLRLAQREWGTSAQAVVAPADEEAALILGAALAAQRGCPLLLGRPEQLQPALRSLGVQRLLAVAKAEGWGQGLADQVESLQPAGAEAALARGYAKAPLRALAAGQVPRGEPSEAAWLLPYYAWARRAGILLLPRRHAGPVPPRTVERRLRNLCRAERLRPRSLLILAHYHELGLAELSLQTPKGEAAESFSFGVEPMAEPGAGKAASLGVGRIPLGPSGASLLLLRSLARKRLLEGEEARALLVANPDPRGEGGLPLAETVARVSARELRNRRVQVAEFYGRASDHPRVRQAATSAHLIVYEGHINDQRLLPNPADELDEDDGDEWFLEGEPRQPLGEPIEDVPQAPPEPPPQGGPPPLERLLPSGGEEPWLGQPVLVLQSCNSLDEFVLGRLTLRGGAGLIGSVTRIHSASGSAYLHALLHGLLERGHTLGEALRDAKNYFLLLSDLKAARGHQEQSKSLRVGLSFRLFGDPELRVFPSRRAPRRPGVEAQLAEDPAGDQLALTFPKRRLVSLRNRGFTVRAYPGSELAGIVRKHKRSGARRILPVHFHRLKAPRGFAKRAYTRLVAPGAKLPACAWRLDEQGRALYVLYFPGREPAGEALELRFVR